MCPTDIVKQTLRISRLHAYLFLDQPRYEYGSRNIQDIDKLRREGFPSSCAGQPEVQATIQEQISVERLNGRLERDFMSEDHRSRGLAKTKLMAASFVMDTMALGKIKGRSQDLAVHTQLA